MGRLRERFVDLLELPRETLLQLPLLLVFGDESIFIENHRGLGLYGKEKIKVVVEPGEIIIRGESLVIQEIHPETLQIRGEIQSIHLFSKGGAECE